MNRPRIAVVGAGHLGSIHARLLQQRSDCQLSAVVDPSAAARRRISEESGVPTVPTLDDVALDIDAAIVATPTVFHFAVAQQLLSRGCHVLIEKPITPSSAEASQLCELAARQERVLQVGHSERFNTAWLTAAPLLSGAHHIRAVRQSGFPSRSLDVGVVLDLMIHEVDLVLALAKAPLIDVRGCATTVVGPHEDIVSARLEFADGMVAELEASRVSPTRERKWQVITPAGLLWIDFAEHSVESAFAVPDFAAQQFHVHTLPYAQRCQFADELFSRWMPQLDHATPPVNALVAEHDEFLQAMQGRRRVTVGGQDGRRAVEVCEWILEAIGTPTRIAPRRPPHTAAEAA